MRKSIFVALCLFFTSCASIFGNKRQEIEFNSEPTGAKVYLNGKYVGNTPIKYNVGVTKGELSLDGGNVQEKSHQVIYAKDNFYKEEFKIERTRDGEGASLINNYSICFADATFSFLTLFIVPAIFIDYQIGSCDGFQKVYFKSLEEKKINTETKIVK